MSNIVPTVEDLFRLQVAHGMEKSMSLKDPGGWPDYEEVTQHIDRMDNSELLFAISMAIEDRLAPTVAALQESAVDLVKRMCAETDQ